MFEIKNVIIGNGVVQFRKEYEGTPTTTETVGDVTINNIGKSPVDPHYEVSFSVEAEFIFNGLKQFNLFSLSCLVPNGDENAPYRSIEAAAAKQVPLMLRALAEGIEKEIAEFDARARGE